IEDVRPVDVATAQAEVAAAVAAVEEAQASLEQAFIKAPTSGQIIDIHTRPGETVGSEGIVTLGETEEMLVIAEVYQADIANIRLGQTATIYTPILSEDLSGSVASIGLQVAPQQVVNEDPAANIDAKIIEVTIRLNDDASARVSQLSNLQVTATIESN
ncbi:MAG: efflux RND transporter periplasmic adaptor subunit, partial [Cyanobacteria bacterium P01_C01_bin.69]